jgi:putative FmdB family regulatory protein
MKKDEGDDQDNETSSFENPCSTFDILSVHGVRLFDYAIYLEWEGTMPIYEYECLSCEWRFQSLVMKEAEEKKLLCPKCGKGKKKRLISRVAYHVSEQDRLAGFNATDAKEDVFFKDSRNIGLAAKKRAKKMGVDLGAGFEEKLEKLRTDPGSVIRDSE